MKSTTLKLALLAQAGVLLLSGAAMAKTKLTMALWLNNPEVKPTQALLDQYEKKTGVKIETIHTDWGSYLNKTLTVIASGKIPDIIVLDRMWLPMFVEKGLVRPLDDIIKTEKFNPKTQLSEWKSGYYKKKFYGIDIWSSPNMLFFYPNMFKEAGVASPYDYISTNRWNWDTFLDVGSKLTRDTNGDGKKEQYGIGQTTWMPDWVGKIWQNGGEVFNEDYSKSLINEPKAVEGLTFWHDISWKYGISPKPGQGGKTAMFYEWISTYKTWSIPLKPKPQMALMPAGKAGYATIAGGCPITISRTTKNAKEAWKFAKWFSMESDMWKTVGAPASREVFENGYQKWMAEYFEHPEFAKKALENAAPEPIIHPRYKEINDIFNENLNALVNNKVTAGAAADKMATAINKVLNRKK